MPKRLQESEKIIKPQELAPQETTTTKENTTENENPIAPKKPLDEVGITAGALESKNEKKPIDAAPYMEITEMRHGIQHILTEELKEFTMTAKRWEFAPTTITVNRGDKVKLTIKSLDVDHGFEISDFNVNKKLVPGETTVVEFTADKTGTFTFSCNVSCGAGHSDMQGRLIVK